VCGSARLTWGSVRDEVGRLVDAGQDPNGWLVQVAQGVGVDVGPAPLDLDAWIGCGPNASSAAVPAVGATGSRPETALICR